MKNGEISSQCDIVSEIVIFVYLKSEKKIILICYLFMFVREWMSRAIYFWFVSLELFFRLLIFLKRIWHCQSKDIWNLVQVLLQNPRVDSCYLHLYIWTALNVWEFQYLCSYYRMFAFLRNSIAIWILPYVLFLQSSWFWRERVIWMVSCWRERGSAP